MGRSHLPVDGRLVALVSTLTTGQRCSAPVEPLLRALQLVLRPVYGHPRVVDELQRTRTQRLRTFSQLGLHDLNRALTFIQLLFPIVELALTLVCSMLAFFSQSFAIVRVPIPLIRCHFPSIRTGLTLVGPATAVPRLSLKLRGAWGDTRVVLPEGAWRHELTDEDVRGGAAPAAALFARFPVALLTRRE